MSKYEIIELNENPVLGSDTNITCCNWVCCSDAICGCDTSCYSGCTERSGKREF